MTQSVSTANATDPCPDCINGLVQFHTELDGRKCWSCGGTGRLTANTRPASHDWSEYNSYMEAVHSNEAISHLHGHMERVGATEFGESLINQFVANKTLTVKQWYWVTMLTQ